MSCNSSEARRKWRDSNFWKAKCRGFLDCTMIVEKSNQIEVNEQRQGHTKIIHSLSVPASLWQRCCGPPRRSRRTYSLVEGTKSGNIGFYEIKRAIQLPKVERVYFVSICEIMCGARS